MLLIYYTNNKWLSVVVPIIACMFVYFMAALFLTCATIEANPTLNRSSLWTNGVNTNGAAAKVMNFDGLGEKGTPWHFGKYKSRLTGDPKSPAAKKHKNVQ